MSQTYTADCYGAGHGGQADLLLMEQNFECLRTLFSGAAAPGTTVAGMPWFDTAKTILKIRNSDDDAWLGVMYGTTATKIWIFENVARNGWAIDAGVTDCILALKGGANAYNAAGGTLAGTWTQPDHTLLEADIPAHTHGTEAAHAHNLLIYIGGAYTYGGFVQAYTLASDLETSNTVSDHTHDSFGGDGAHSHGNTWRPIANIGTLQYPDV